MKTAHRAKPLSGEVIQKEIWIDNIKENYVYEEPKFILECEVTVSKMPTSGTGFTELEFKMSTFNSEVYSYKFNSNSSISLSLPNFPIALNTSQPIVFMSVFNSSSSNSGSATVSITNIILRTENKIIKTIDDKTYTVELNYMGSGMETIRITEYDLAEIPYFSLYPSDSGSYNENTAINLYRDLIHYNYSIPEQMVFKPYGTAKNQVYFPILKARQFYISFNKPANARFILYLVNKFGQKTEIYNGNTSTALNPLPINSYLLLGILNLPSYEFLEIEFWCSSSSGSVTLTVLSLEFTYEVLDLHMRS